MKRLLIPLLFPILATASTIPSIDAEQYTCEDLKKAIANAGKIQVKAGMTSKVFVSGGEQCPRGYQNRASFVRSQDVSYCAAGMGCERRRGRGGGGR